MVAGAEPPHRGHSSRSRRRVTCSSLPLSQRAVGEGGQLLELTPDPCTVAGNFQSSEDQNVCPAMTIACHLELRPMGRMQCQSVGDVAAVDDEVVGCLVIGRSSARVEVKPSQEIGRAHV